MLFSYSRVILIVSYTMNFIIVYIQQQSLSQRYDPDTKGLDLSDMYHDDG